ncbi:MAG: ABC transporter ATP-binding protein [Leptolyngbyaceae cyanobacterium MO_188.B28]|nr:ABC transporter ATP-binding protein [Leptolyngbyaceae cyanobacterium MO_188.B28]
MIEAEYLNKTYGSTAAIQDVSFRVEPGEILGFLGPNGAGKTTTMRILTGYLPATSGSARIADYEVHTHSMEVRKRIGYLPETPPLYREMTVERFLHFVAQIKGVAAGDRSQRVESAMRRCNLLEKRSILIRKLSKGFRQRVGIAQAIVHDPPAIILDEPTVGLDPRQIIEVRNLIKSLSGEHTIILSTHILPEASMTCNRVAIINQGKIVATDTPDNLMSRLAGEAGYEVEIQGDLQLALQRLEAIDGIRTATVMEIEGLPQDRHRLQVVSDGNRDSGGEMASVLIGAGLGLYELRRTRVSLEDVFLNLTTQEKTEDSSMESTFAPTEPDSPQETSTSDPANGPEED